MTRPRSLQHTILLALHAEVQRHPEDFFDKNFKDANVEELLKRHIRESGRDYLAFRLEEDEKKW